LRVLVTGAGGFLGPYVVRSCRQRGHEVRALVRTRGSEPLWFAEDPGVELRTGDLRSKATLENLLDQVDAVVHLAAAKQGDFHAQFSGTVIATERLLAAMREASTARLVLVSSFAVYDYENAAPDTIFDETVPIVAKPSTRDSYAYAKIRQEQLCRGYALDSGVSLVVLRPGVVFGPGPDNYWSFRLGHRISKRLWLGLGGGASLPLTFVENCADAVASAVDVEVVTPLTINVVDGETPTQREYLHMIAPYLPERPRTVWIPAGLALQMARALALINDKGFDGRLQVPSALRVQTVEICTKRGPYGNSASRVRLGWQPRVSISEGVARTFAATRRPHADASLDR
jgi:nucleoside-diphosphate-sugar epimerase